MTKYFSTQDVSCLVKLSDSGCKSLQKIDYPSNIIDYIYEIDEDGELITETNEIIVVNKGDIVLRLYGAFVNGVYKRSGRTHIVVSPNKQCDMSLFVKVATAVESKTNHEMSTSNYNCLTSVSEAETALTPDECYTA